VFVGKGGSAAPLVSFVLDTPQSNGTIALEIGSFVDSAVRRFQPSLLQSGSLMGVELGSEFRAPEPSPLTWKWTMNGLDLCTSAANVEVIPFPVGSPSSCPAASASLSRPISADVASIQPAPSTPESPQVLLFPAAAIGLVLAAGCRRWRAPRGRSAQRRRQWGSQDRAQRRGRLA
jgi:hypothetical protein